MADAPAAAPVAAPAPAAAPAPVAAAPAAAPAAAAPAAPAPAAPAAAPPVDPGIRFGDDPPADGEVKDPVEGEKPEGEKPEGEATDPPVYEFKLPDGVSLGEEALTGVKAAFAAAKVPPDQAQALFDSHINAIKAATESATQTLLDNWKTTKASWEGEIKADKDIGGAKLEQSIASIRKGAETLLGTEAAKSFRQALDSTGAGSNPAVVKALFKAFSIHAPATQVSGKPAGAKEARTAGATLYPTQAGLGNASIN